MEFIQLTMLMELLILQKIPGYIDPGSASAFMAVIIGAIAGVGMTVKMYWFKIKSKISK
tara:strand:- start:321 stop:497 length:177 start_codon:yes stop_codon:yes gene_type:complete